MTLSILEDMFSYHPPSPERAALHTAINELALESFKEMA
jgi:hypothetical protein